MTCFSIILTACLCTEIRMFSGFLRPHMLFPLLDKNTLVI